MLSKSRGGLAAWGAAVAVYVMAIAGRSSFGVAGLEAIDRFHVGAATLSLFTVIQVGVYAGAQIPVGLLVDRYGTRKVLVSGAFLMAAGQILLGLAGSLPAALAVRVLIGLGDATAYSAVLRLLPAWFEPRHVPLMTQLTGTVGQMGQVISSLPFAYVLTQYGWEPAFVALGGSCAVVALTAIAWVKDSPVAREAPKKDEEPLTFWTVAREPGVWLGFFTHFSCGFMPMVFQLLWGSPFLQVVNGMSKSSAAAMLMIQPIAGLLIAPLIGRLTGAHPLRRTWMVYTSVALAALAWVPFFFGEPRPTIMVVGLLVMLAVASACSGIGFDFVRTSIDVRRVGTGNGIVNMGGFSATLICAWLIGAVLDARSPSGTFTVRDFQMAMMAQFALLAIGVVGIVISKRATRKKMADDGVVVPPIRDVWARYHDHETSTDQS